MYVFKEIFFGAIAMYVYIHKGQTLARCILRVTLKKYVYLSMYHAPVILSTQPKVYSVLITISISNHTLLSTIRAVISTLTCTSMASYSTSDSECY